MAEALARILEGPDGAGVKTQGVGIKVIVPEHRPDPTDDRVGVDVRRGNPVLLDQFIPETNDARQIVDAKGVGGPHGGDDHRHFLPGGEGLAQIVFEVGQGHLIVPGVGDGHQVFRAQPQPGAGVEAGIMGGGGGHDFQVITHPFCHAPAPQIFFQAQLHSVEDGAGAAEGEDPAGPFGVIAHQIRKHGHRLDFRLGETGGVFIPDDVGIEERRRHDGGDAGDGGRRNDVHLGVGVAPHGHSPAIVNDVGGNFLHGVHLFREAYFLDLLIASLLAAPQKRRRRFQIIHPVQEAGQGVNEIAVQNGIGDRVRKAVFQMLQDFRIVKPLLKIH